MAVGRPGPLRWLYYAYGGGLPHRYAQWVLHDLTSKFWLLRHLSRTLAQCAPALLLLLFPAAGSILAMMLGIVLFGALYVSFSFATEARYHRLYKAGFVPELVLTRHDDEDG
jgi:Family of unknown function (DUF5313)